MKNVADEREIDRAREASKAREHRNDRVLRSLLSSAEGRGYLWDTLSSAQVFGQTLVLSPEGYAATAFKEGKRSLGLKLLADIQRLDPNAYLLMSRENNPTVFPDEPESENSDE